MGSRTSPEKSNLDNHIAWPKIKKEAPDNEIKEFAETAMNELLGWYGYEKIARDDTTLLKELPAARINKKKIRKQPSEPPSDLDTSEDDIPRPCTPLQQKSTSADANLANDSCGWCSKMLNADSSQTLTSANGSFCSELCFAQSRRASFKKNKTCDWCRHVRHTVSYVDFQDGASQLQFCSDKCLNQYKMHIFCREAQAHLEIHPHLHSAGDSSVQQGLITPDLWLRNCRSPSNEPRTPSSCSPSNSLSNTINDNIPDMPNKQPHQTSPLPLITIAHPSKLMYNNNDKRATEDITFENNVKVITNNKSKKRRNSQCSSTITSTVNIQKEHNCIAQDLRIQQNSSPNIIQAHSRSEGKLGVGAKLNDFSENTTTNSYKNHTNTCTSNPIESNGFPPYMLFGPRQPQYFSPDPRLFAPNVNLFPPPSHIFAGTPRVPPPLPVSPVIPPVTILVPYPVMVPIPLPIPLPVPLADFLKAAMAANTKSQTKNNEPQSDVSISSPKINSDSPNTQQLPETDKTFEKTVKIQSPNQSLTNESNKNLNVNNFGNIDSIPSPMRPLRKRKRIMTKETNKEVNCKTRKPKYLST